ncbi:MAG TPA: 3-deoxy-manno-octulosonate cytidylyltransferase [Terriglobales bacterium]|nr:3-deoxy-manno-octulosonate cytidylyltransferase [Terriglobales bacterium]
MKIVAIIPARLGSTRLPRKILREISGKPMISWVYEAARGSKLLDEVIVATDSGEIMDVCRANGYTARMTSPNCKSGTERVYEVSREVEADVYVNVQGDEPLTRPEHLDVLVTLMKKKTVQVGTIKTKCTQVDVNNPNAVKVVCDQKGKALYFSRATIPFDRDKTGKVEYFKHLGFYAYRKPALEKFITWPESQLELSERLEQLRFLDNGISLHVTETPFDTVGVDTEQDLRRVEDILRRPR